MNLTAEQVYSAVDGQRTLAQLAETLGFPANNVSFHITQLRKAGRIENDGRGKPWRHVAPGVAAKTLRDIVKKPRKSARIGSAKRLLDNFRPQRAKTLRKQKTPPEGMPWSSTGAIEIPKAPCKAGEHGDFIDGLLMKRAELVTHVAGKVAAIDNTIQQFIEVDR